MEPGYLLQVPAVMAEAAVAAAALYLGYKRKRLYGWFFAIAFAIFVLFDLIRLGRTAVPLIIQSALLLVAALSSLVAISDLLHPWKTA